MFGMGSIFGTESPKKDVFDDGTPGTGPYPAHRFTDPVMKNYTMYAPKAVRADVRLPVLVFGNGGCGNTGSAFTNLLTEIASHGYLAIANGAPAADPKGGPMGSLFGGSGGFNLSAILGGLFSGGAAGGAPKMPSFGGFESSSVAQMTKAVDWVVGGGAAKYGNIDTSKIAASGQSCGGLQVGIIPICGHLDMVYSAHRHTRRVIMMTGSS
jgi:hypothetical protein